MHRSITSWLTSLATSLLALCASGIALGQTAPVLVVGNPSNLFATYYTQILRTEGLNSSDFVNLASVSAATLTGRDVVILGETSLTAAQVTMFTTWVNGGGNLIAMRPDKQLAGLLGLTDQAATLANGYLGINTAQAPGFGLVGQTMQFHGAADRYTLNGATSVATLYSNATTATTSPAVTWRGVGASGGKAAAFTYDLARSIVYTRQGNPAWAGTERDGVPVIRSSDMFVGAAPGDPQTDWVDRSKIGIPQADEQQRLLANLIEFMNLARKPLPRFWYFPNGKKAAVVMTGDDHANGGTIGRFDAFTAASTPGCVVANWECIRGTSYIYPGTPIPTALASSYNSQGFELAVHVSTNCADYTPASLENFFTTNLQQFAAAFPALPTPVTNRTHCIAFTDWSSQPKVELANGIRMDTNYYYFPGPWVNDTPGFMTGSGMPQRFADLDGTVIDTYQSETQMTDESNQSYPATINTLLDRAIGSQGYYGFFNANIHTDSSTNITQTWAMDLVNSAKARGVPVITAKQLLTWVDARNNSTFTNLGWSGNTLTFTATPAANSNGLQVMLPKSAASGTVAFITRSGNSVTFATEAIKGITYVVFNAVAGNYTVSYSGPAQTITVAPTTANLGLSAAQNFTATVTGVTSVTWSMNPSFGTLTSTGPTTATYTSPATASGPTNVQITATGVGAPGLTASATATVTPPVTNCPCSIFSPSAVPAVPAGTDPSSVELGVKFRAAQNGFITGIRFYKGTGNGGTHIGNLWSASGANLATATFQNETATGWQQVNFGSPVPVNANTTYVASYFAPVGRYPFNSAFFSSATVNGPLRGLADGEDGGNGAYRYGATGGFPNSTWNATNYWVDVVYVTSIANQAPVATADSYTATLNQPLTVAAPGVLANDTDANGNPLTAIKVSNPANGALTLNNNGSFTYSPNAGFTGTNTFSYKANDGTADSNTVTVTITVSAAAPVAVADIYSGTSGQALTIGAPGLLSNDTSPGAIALTAIRVTNAANGNVTVNPNGGFTYTPNAGFVGTDSFTYKANNGTTDSNTVTVTLCACTIWNSTAVPANLAEPTDTSALELGTKFRTTQAGFITGIRFYKGTGNSGTHIGNLWNSAGTNLATATFQNETATGWQQVSFTTPVAVAANTTYVASYFAPVGRYSHNPNYFATATVNGPLRGLANNEDGGNGLYRYGATSGFPSSTWNATNYWVDVVYVTSISNQAPVATADSYTAIQNQPLTVAAPGVLANDTDANGNPLTAIKVSDPANGALAWNSNGSFTYTPNAGFTGTNTFSYKANDGTADSNTVTVTITVNALPTAANDSYSTNQGMTLNIAAPGVLGNDASPGGFTLIATKLSDPANGALTLNANGSFTYVPNAGFAGTNTFTYRAGNSVGNSNTATVTITVNAAPVATGDSYSVSAGQPITIPAPGVLGNDTSPGGLPLTAIKLSNPANGSATLNSNGSFTYTPNAGFSGTNTFTYKANNGTVDSNIATVTITVFAIPVASNDAYSASTGTPLTVAAPGVLSNDTGANLTAIKVSNPANGTVTLSPNGGFTYAPNAGFTGTNTFTYKVNNGLIDSNTATVTLTVSSAPIASNDSYSATTGVALNIGAPGVLSNDTGGTLTAIKLTDPANGAVTMNSNGSFTYVSTAGFTGTNTFTYRANNGTANSNIATVTITVNAAPTAVADIYSGTSGQALTVSAPGLLSNDTSPGGIALTAIRVTNAANGNVTVNPNGGFTYTPNAGFVGTDSFTYKANNGTADSNTVTVTLCACTIWNSTAVPANLSEPTDTSAVELGVKFRATTAGYIKGIRFYKGTGNSGTHIGNLWNSAGTNLATATFSSESATGWQQVLFTTPVAVTANTTYVASYFAPVGRYSYNANYFSTATVNGPLRGLAEGEDGGNGLYRYGATSGFPSSTWNATNYWIDVIFSTVP